jgi:hypothetical protein
MRRGGHGGGRHRVIRSGRLGGESGCGCGDA